MESKDVVPEDSSEHLERLEKLLKETHDLAKENNKLLRRMERNALISFFFKILIWLVILGVPIFFLSPYLTPLISAVSSGTASSTIPSSLLGLPSIDQAQKLLEAVKPAQK